MFVFLDAILCCPSSESSIFHETQRTQLVYTTYSLILNVKGATTDHYRLNNGSEWKQQYSHSVTLLHWIIYWTKTKPLA